MPHLPQALNTELSSVDTPVLHPVFPDRSSKDVIAKGKSQNAENILLHSGDATTKKSVFQEGFLGQLHRPSENSQVWTRFPPEPNGYLRYDDTNPEKEESRYFENILQMVRWLGYEPWKITYSSDYFDRLYELALELIKRDKAYVCHCTQEDIKADRGEKRGQPRPCVHRSRPISESLSEFESMKNGKYRSKEANLRMKQDLEDGNPQMWDLIAYRVQETPHHRTQDKWKIYPTYDFTHCLVDSFENISHSLCTTEFVASRQSYEWLCDAAEVYKPRQYEYGRLNLEGTIMSKRKINALVRDGYVSGWDDPRLYTLIALRRRGVPPGAIISFVSSLGVSTAASNIETSRFEQSIRQFLEGSVPRLLIVMQPLKVIIENLKDDHLDMVEKQLHPKIHGFGTSKVPFTRTIYIESDDFRVEASKDYFRLSPGRTVGLFGVPYPISYVSHEIDEVNGRVTKVVCRLQNDGPVKKPKAYVQWVAEHEPSKSPVKVDEVRLFHRLFKSLRPNGEVADLAPNSLEIVKGAIIESGFWDLAKQLMKNARENAKDRTEKALKENKISDLVGLMNATADQLVGKECVRFQGLRVAYFSIDQEAWVRCLDTDRDLENRHPDDYLILNRIVSLKEDSGKRAK